MRIRKENSIFSAINSAIIDLPSLVSISYFWNFGSLLGLCLVIQIITGIFLMHYCAYVTLAFSSIAHITGDVNYGFVLKYLPANGASAFFLCLCSHCKRVILRKLSKTSPLILRNYDFVNNDVNCFHPLFLTLRSNVILMDYGYYQLSFSHSLHMKRHCSMSVRWI